MKSTAGVDKPASIDEVPGPAAAGARQPGLSPSAIGNAEWFSPSTADKLSATLGRKSWSHVGTAPHTLLRFPILLASF